MTISAELAQARRHIRADRHLSRHHPMQRLSADAEQSSDVNHGHLSAVIDFGGLAVGDPACDFVAAWTLFSGESRDAFRVALSIDDASWARSRGWALSTGLIALPYYLDTNPVIVAMARHQIDEVLADRKRTC